MPDTIVCTLYCHSRAIGEVALPVGEGLTMSSGPLQVFPAYADVRTELRNLIAEITDVRSPEELARQWTKRLAAADLELRTADNRPIPAEGLLVVDCFPADADPILVPRGPVCVGARLQVPTT